MTHVIAFANQKGGVAKTTTTLNLGVALKEQGFRVLGIDLDPQGNLTMSQGWNPDEIERSMFEALVHQLPIEEIIRPAEIDIAVSSLGLLTINALVACDGVIVPVQCEYLSLRGLVQLQNTMEMIRENLNPNVDIQGILATMYDRRLIHAREAVEILRENFGDLVYNTKIRKTVRFAEAPVKGQSVLTYDPTSEAAMLYRDLAKEVLNGAKAREHA